MKKTLTIVTLFVMLIALTITGVKASSATLANDIYSKLEPYGATNVDKVRVERYVADNNVTDAQATEVLAKVDEAIAIMNAEGVKDYHDLSANGKERVKALAQEVANVVGLTLTFSEGKVNIYGNAGKLLDTQDIDSTTSGTLAYTGNNNTALVVSSIAVIALAAIVVAKKGFAKVGA